MFCTLVESKTLLQASTMLGHTPIKTQCILLFAALLVGSFCGMASSSAYLVVQKPVDAHRHLKLGDVMQQVLPDVEVAEVSLDKSVMKENPARSRDRRYEAFTSSDPTQFRIYFIERGTGKVYEVRGLPLPYRPFSNLSWVNNRTLVFDRWSQPHYGIHYAIDAREKKLVKAAAFPDEFYLEQQRPKPPRNKKQ